MKCPDCHGKCYFVGIAHYDLIKGKSFNKFVEQPCSRCDAKGEVPDEMQKWIDIGQRMRVERMKRKEVQRVAANRMGVTIKQYQDMEAGRIGNEHI
jgi:hypothetical protein